MVDFPSFGSDDVKPMTLLGMSVKFKLIAILMERIDSAKGDKGESTTLQNTLESRAIVLWPNALSKRLLARQLIWLCSFQQRDQS